MFDRNRDGTINYDEFLRLIRVSLLKLKNVQGDMNDFRKDLVERVYIILDKNNDGVIDVDDIKHFFNAKKHPDVILGKRSEQAVLLEFLDTFEQHA